MRLIGEKILKDFFYNYLILNDKEKIEELICEDFKSVGTSKHEVAKNKYDFLESIERQIKNINGKMSFYIKNYTEDIIENIISSYCEVSIIFYSEEEKRINTRLTTVFIYEKGKWKIVNMHNSIAEISQKEEEMFPIDLFQIEDESEQAIYLPTKFKKAFLEIDEINYITYSSANRKVIFYLKNLEKYEIKRNFSEVNEKLNILSNFYKLDRGTIINLENIKILDFKEEKILFENKQKLYISKLKLKELEAVWMNLKKKNKIEI